MMLHCNTLQHAATRCNTLQHAATHYNTLQHTTTTLAAPVEEGMMLPNHTLQHNTTHCNTTQHNAPHCTALQHITPHCNTLQHTATTLAAPVEEGMMLPDAARPPRQSLRDEESTTACVAVMAWMVVMRPGVYPCAAS